MRIYLDSCIVIYAMEGVQPVRTTVRQKHVPDANRPLSTVFCALTRLVCRIGSKQHQKTTLLDQSDQFFSTPGFIRKECDTAVFDLATDLRTAHDIKTPGTLHLADALASGFHEFWTNDHRMADAAGTQLQVVAFIDHVGAPPSEL